VGVAKRESFSEKPIDQFDAWVVVNDERVQAEDPTL
jgi:hypothetical protein